MRFVDNYGYQEFNSFGRARRRRLARRHSAAGNQLLSSTLFARSFWKNAEFSKVFERKAAPPWLGHGALAVAGLGEAGVQRQPHPVS